MFSWYSFQILLYNFCYCSGGSGYALYNHTLHIPRASYLVHLNSCTLASFFFLLVTLLPSATVTSIRTHVLSSLLSVIVCVLFTITSLRAPYCYYYCYLLKFTMSKNSLFTFRNFWLSCADSQPPRLYSTSRWFQVSLLSVCWVPSKRPQSLSHWHITC